MHSKNGVELFFEHYRAEYLAKEIYKANGLSYDLDHIIISLIGECLKYISAEKSYKYVKNLISREEFDLLNYSDIQPWDYLKKDILLWRTNPYFSYLLNRVKRSPVMLIKKLLLSTPLTRPIAEYLQYRVIEKWSLNNG